VVHKKNKTPANTLGGLLEFCRPPSQIFAGRHWLQVAGVTL